MARIQLFHFGLIFGKVLHKLKAGQKRRLCLYHRAGNEMGGLLVEALIGITISMLALGSFLSFMGESFAWAQRFHGRNELMYENMTGRQVLRYALLNTDSPVTVNYNSRYLMWEGKRRYGIEYGELRRMLDNGQKQALSSPTISPNLGSLQVTSIDGRPHFIHRGLRGGASQEGPIHMEWQMIIKPTSALVPNMPPEWTSMTIYPMHMYFMAPSQEF